MGAGLTYADRRKNLTKPAGAFWHYANLLQPTPKLNSSNTACDNVTSFGVIVQAGLVKPHITQYNLILFKIKITKENKEIETLTLAQRKKKPV